MLTKRLVLVVISLVLGFLVTTLALYLMNTTPDEFGTYFGTEGDGLPYYPLTIVSFAVFFGLILDKFLGTDLLPK